MDHGDMTEIVDSAIWHQTLQKLSIFNVRTKIVSMIRKYHNRKLLTQGRATQPSQDTRKTN